jgi:hypothetical protein
MLLYVDQFVSSETHHFLWLYWVLFLVALLAVDDDRCHYTLWTMSSCVIRASSADGYATKSWWYQSGIAAAYDRDILPEIRRRATLHLNINAEWFEITLLICLITGLVVSMEVTMVIGLDSGVEPKACSELNGSFAFVNCDRWFIHSRIHYAEFSIYVLIILWILSECQLTKLTQHVAR